MADIPATLVKKLRDLTDAGMMECKKALVEVGGDIEKAITHLKEKGLSKAAKKTDRVAAEGAISVSVDENLNNAVMVEINSETDFVAKNDGFKELVAKTTSVIKDKNIKELAVLENENIDGVSFSDYLKTQIAKIGENIVVRRLANISADANSLVNGYLHSNGRVGVLIKMSFTNAASKSAVGALAKQICMHIAAMKPSVLSFKDFDLSFVEKEKIAIIAELEKENEEFKRLGKPLHKIPKYISALELNDVVLKNVEDDLKAELKSQNKPEAIWDKIIPGQLERFKADSTILDQRLTLLGQFFVMDDKKTIEQVLAQKSTELNDTIQIVEFVRFELGEGIEKVSNNFADEVAAQLG